MAERFGEYITNEYGLLKHILSCLEPCALRNAKLVCRDWHGAIETLLDKNPQWLVFHSCSGNGSLPTLQKPTLPSVVLSFLPGPSLIINCKEERLCKDCVTPNHICPCTISDSDTVFISIVSDIETGAISPFQLAAVKPTEESSTLEIWPLHNGELYDFWDYPSALLFPRNSPQLNISTYYGAFPKRHFKTLSDDFMNECLGGQEPIKCLIILTGPSGHRRSNKGIQQFINKIIERQGLTFAVGGGLVEELGVKKGFSRIQIDSKIVHLIIAIRGDNVTAHSDLLVGYCASKYQSFMQEMSERVGPLPEGSQRVAFLAQCVNRSEYLVEKSESQAFKQAFPSVPQFGFKAFGEYGIRSSSEEHLKQAPPAKKRKEELLFTHGNTTSIVILTFKTI